MFVLVVFLSYLLGCISTVVLSILLFIRYGLHSPGKVLEQEQYQRTYTLPENFQAANSSVDALNHCLHTLFQESKDGSGLRRFFMEKLQVEIEELKASLLGGLFFKDIIILSFSIGRECPVLNNIQLQRYERDKRQQIREFVARISGFYRDGFSCTLEVQLPFDYQCQVYIKVRRVQGNVHLEFRREPYCHWLVVFQGKPLIDVEIKSYLSTRECPLLSKFIWQYIYRIIRNKHIWPKYKLRYLPFFSKSRPSFPVHIPSRNLVNCIPGIMDITIKHCDRLLIPYELFQQENSSLLSVFLTLNIREEPCNEYLQINRNHWRRFHIDFLPQKNRISLREVFYLGHREFLIEELSSIPNEIDNIAMFQAALNDKNAFLLEIEHQELKTMKQINRLLKLKSANDLRPSLRMIIGTPLLKSVQVQCASRISTNTKDEPSSITSERKDEEHLRESKNSTKKQSTTKQNLPQKTVKSESVVLAMLNTDLAPEFEIRTPTQIAETFVTFNNEFQLRIGPHEHYLNVCLWCKPPLDFNIPNSDRNIILLGYATAALSEIVLDAHMSFKRETQVELNFRSAYTPKENLHIFHSNSKNRSLAELSTHKWYDDNLAHGFVTLLIKHTPTISIDAIDDSLIETIVVDDEQQSLEESMSASEEYQSNQICSTNHVFEDRTFSTGTLCSYCHKKIWIETYRQCLNCFIAVHKQCESKFSNDHLSKQDPASSTALVPAENYSMLTANETGSSINIDQAQAAQLSATIGAVAAISVMEYSENQTLHPLINTALNVIPKIVLPANSIFDNISSIASPSNNERRLVTHIPIQASAKLINIAALAYSKLRNLKVKRTSVPMALNTRRPLALKTHENISEEDLQDMIATCLSGEVIDSQIFENFVRERSIDHTLLYVQANKLGTELFSDLTLDERKHKFENEITRLQQEIDLQDQIRDELIIEYNDASLVEENAKRKLQVQILNVEEKIQALAALTILYCSGLRYCYSQLKEQNDIN